MSPQISEPEANHIDSLQPPLNRAIIHRSPWRITMAGFHKVTDTILTLYMTHVLSTGIKYLYWYNIYWLAILSCRFRRVYVLKPVLPLWQIWENSYFKQLPQATIYLHSRHVHRLLNHFVKAFTAIYFHGDGAAACKGWGVSAPVIPDVLDILNMRAETCTATDSLYWIFNITPSQIQTCCSEKI